MAAERRQQRYLFPWERLLTTNSNQKVRSGLATAGGKEAPTARTLQWSAKDVSLNGQKEFELGLPIIMADDATVRFAFTTHGGDISFSATFITSELRAVGATGLLKERTREMSHTREVRGEIVIRKPGTLLLKWDNKGGPWRMERLLSYRVCLFYPGAEELRSEVDSRSRVALRGLQLARSTVLGKCEELQAFRVRCAESEADLELRIAGLQSELEQVRQARETAGRVHWSAAREEDLLRTKTSAAVLFHVIQAGWIADGDGGKAAAAARAREKQQQQQEEVERSARRGWW